MRAETISGSTPRLDNATPLLRSTLTVPCWSVGLLGSAFLVLALLTAGPNTLALDVSVSHRIQAFDGSFAQFLGWLGDYLGETTIALTFLAISLVASILLRSALDAWFLGIAAILRLSATLLKGIFDSPRPTIDQVDQARVFESTGFPSGHATTASLLMGTVAFLIFIRTDRPTIRMGMAALWVLGTATTSFARIWHGAHWFTDTVGGAIIGLVIVLVAAKWSASMVRRRSTGQPQTRPQTPAR